MREVAKSSGVSVSTVSRVLSGSGYPVSEEIREKVLQSAKKLNYTGTKAVRSSVLKEIAAVVPTVANPFYASMTARFGAEISSAGYSLVTYASCFENTRELLIKSIQEKNYTGILIASADMYNEFVSMAEDGKLGDTKLVFADCPFPQQKFSSVCVDYRKGAHLGTEYLIQCGHRNIVYAGMILDRESRILRLQGFRDALALGGIPFQDSMLLIASDYEKTSEMYQTEVGEALAREIIARENRPTAVVVVNDMVAFGMLRFFANHHISVPEDISVLGFDDNIFCQVCNPPLSTVKVQDEQIGRMAAKLLLDDIESANEAGSVNLRIEPSVVDRGTIMKLR